MTRQSVKVDSYLIDPPASSTEPELDLAMLRAYSIERSIDYGCSVEDVLKLRRRVENGASWVDVTLLLAKDNAARAEMERQAGLSKTAAAFYLDAAACLRLAQAALEERPAQRLAVYLQNVAAFSSAMELLGYTQARIEVTHNGARHGGWFFRSHGEGQTEPPCVLVWGGADGWCEAFFGSVPMFLERGLAVCLLELPGQGLARLQHRSFLGSGFTGMISATLDQLSSLGAAKDRFGVAGHSFGGSLALLAASADERIRASCTNGGSVDMKKSLTKFPRVLKRVGRMTGYESTETEVLDLMHQLKLEEAVAGMQTPVLCLHGGQDILVTDEEAHRLLALRSPHLSTYEYWPEGVHCLNNHSLERNGVMTDWFAQRL